MCHRIKLGQSNAENVQNLISRRVDKYIENFVTEPFAL